MKWKARKAHGSLPAGQRLMCFGFELPAMVLDENLQAIAQMTVEGVVENEDVRFEIE